LCIFYLFSHFQHCLSIRFVHVITDSIIDRLWPAETEIYSSFHRSTPDPANYRNWYPTSSQGAKMCYPNSCCSGVGPRARNDRWGVLWNCGSARGTFSQWHHAILVTAVGYSYPRYDCVK
jgi:hypothetical protein